MLFKQECITPGQDTLSVCLMCYDNGVYSEQRSHNCMVTEVKKSFFISNKGWPANAPMFSPTGTFVMMWT